MKNKHFNIIWCGEITNIKYLHKFKYYGRIFVMVRRKDWSFTGKYKYDIYDYPTGFKVAYNYTNYQQCKIDAKLWVSRNVNLSSPDKSNATNIINK